MNSVEKKTDELMRKTVKNKDCVKYLNKIKDGHTFPYALLSGFLQTLICSLFFFFLWLSNSFNCDPGIIFFVITLILANGIFITYKVFGCFYARSICGGSCYKD
jgi:hypothetical protein